MYDKHVEIYCTFAPAVALYQPNRSMNKPSDKNFGAILDRTLKVIKLNYLHAFRELGLDLTTEQWIILDRLAQDDGITQTELGNDSFKNAPTVSRIVELMRKKGLLFKRQADTDKRQYLIFLSDAGRQIHQTALPHVQQLRRQGWQGLDDADYDTFVRIMQQITNNFNGCDLSADGEPDL